jgi:hypothetical protein
MGWSGGTFTRVHDWTTDEGSAIDIEADRMDAEDDNFAAGINACIHKGGTNSPTANLPMGGYRHTGVDDAAALTDYASAADVIDQHLVYYADTGSANAYVITPSPAITAYAAGQKFSFKASNGNTAASTLNVNGLGTKSIVLASGVDVASGDILSGSIYEVVYDGTDMQLVSPSGTTYAEQIKYKSSSTSRNSTETYADDPELANYYLTNGAKYRVEGFLVVNEATGTGGGFRVKVNGSGTGYITLMEAGGDTIQTDAITTGAQVSSWGGNVNGIVITGVFVPSSSGNVSLSWAQQTSDSDNTTLNQRSWFGFTRIE